MAKSGVITKVELDRETDLDLKRWAEESERSKCRQIAVLLRRMVSLKKSNPEAIRELQLAN